MYPFSVINTTDNGDTPPPGENFVVDYTDAQVVTFNNEYVIANEV